jgi:hypothetical protein
MVLLVLGAGAWAALHYKISPFNYLQQTTGVSSNVSAPGDAWAMAIQKVKENRTEPGGPIETPPELRHYSDRHWFLATQVAEIEKHGVPTCQDFVDLAAMIERGEIVSVPAVTDSYVLYGVGERADDDMFNRYEDERSVELYSNFAPEVRYSVHPVSQQLAEEHDALYKLARDFVGRSYNLDDPSDRQAFKVNMLRTLRPAAFKILQEVASAYHRQFNRPLPVSSLMRPEQYQHALRRVNRNAVLIETPPHSTGLAFDIDYRYMSGGEQTFVMGELARLKRDGQIEVIRERNANYHVFAFLDGTRPRDDLISASLEKAGAPVEALHHAEAKPAKPKAGRQQTKKHLAKAKRRRK